MEPVLAQVEKEYAGKVEFKSYNITEERGKAQDYSISYVPTCVFLGSDGRVEKKVVGQQSLAKVREYLDALVQAQT